MKKESDFGAGIFTRAFIMCFIALLVGRMFMPDHGKKFYVRDCFGKYCVFVYTDGSDFTMTKPISLEEATELVKKLNADLGVKP